MKFIKIQAMVTATKLSETVKIATHKIIEGMNNTANMKESTDGQTWRRLQWFEIIFILWFLKTQWPNSFSKFISNVKIIYVNCRVKN